MSVYIIGIDPGQSGGIVALNNGKESEKNIMKEDTIKRKQIDLKLVEASINNLKDKIEFRLKEKGKGTLASKHEIVGIITEEYYEMIEATHLNNLFDFENELMDIAVGCIFGIACIKAGTLDW